MKHLNLNGPQDVLALLVRRKWWILIPFLAFSSAAVLLVYILPKMYVSEALVLIQPRDVPSDLVRNLIAGSTAERLSAIEQTVLSRKNMVQVAREFENQLTDIRNLDMDQKVVKIRNQVGLNFSANNGVGSGQLPVTYFRISYQDRNPELAQKIATTVTDLFIRQDNEVREKQVGGTTEFFTVEVAKLAEQLKVSDGKLKQLRGRRRNELPSQTESNLRRLDNIQSSQQSISEQLLLSGDYLRKLEQQISETPEFIPKPVVAGPPVATIARDPKIQDYRNVKARLKDLNFKGYKASHPDVQMANLQLERLKQELSAEDLVLAEQKEEKPDAPVAAVVETMPNPRYLALLESKNELLRSIGIIENRKKLNEEGIVILTRRIENAPDAEEDLVDIVRENTDLYKQYDVMKGKLAESTLAETLEGKQKGAQFRILDAANLPLSATKPKKYVLAGLGVLFSLMGGIAIGFAIDIANQKMWTSSDVEALLGATVLVEIPEIITVKDILTTKKRKITQVASLLAVTAAYGAALYFVYLHQGYVLRQLDPFLQRFY